MVGKVHEGEEEEGDDDDPYVEDGVDALPINEPPEAFPSAKLDCPSACQNRASRTFCTAASPT